MIEKSKGLFGRKNIKTMLSVILMIALFVCSGNVWNTKFYAYEEKSAVIVGNDTYIYVYAEPSASSTEYKKLEPGKEVTDSDSK